MYPTKRQVFQSMQANICMNKQLKIKEEILDLDDSHTTNDSFQRHEPSNPIQNFISPTNMFLRQPFSTNGNTPQIPFSFLQQSIENHLNYTPFSFESISKGPHNFNTGKKQHFNSLNHHAFISSYLAAISENQIHFDPLLNNRMVSRCQLMANLYERHSLLNNHKQPQQESITEMNPSIKPYGFPNPHFHRDFLTMRNCMLSIMHFKMQNDKLCLRNNKAKGQIFNPKDDRFHMRSCNKNDPVHDKLIKILKLHALIVNKSTFCFLIHE